MAVAALFTVVVLSHPSAQTTGVFFLIFAAACYAAAEFAVSKTRLYRYGIEEALAVCSVGFLCAGIQAAFFSGRFYFSSRPDAAMSLVEAGVAISLWIWGRFGFSYAFLAAMIFALFLPGYWTASHSAQHLIIVAFYTIGLIYVSTARSRHPDYLSLLAHRSVPLARHLPGHQPPAFRRICSRDGGMRRASEFAVSGLWVLIWCLRLSY
jgi:hypothetical protein